MHADLERVIALQRLDTAASDARKKLAEGPEREKLFAERLEAAKARVADAKARLAENQDARRTIEKDVAMHQGRLSKFREQAMAVKTNQEYHAIQHEITFAQSEVKKIEDAILERMMESDDLAADLKAAEGKLAAETKAVEADRRMITVAHADMEAALERIAAERAALVGSLDAQVLRTFDNVSRKRNGVAVAEARDGVCTICHVRLRPQVFNTVRRNEEIVQCDSCNRILYFVAAGEAAPDASAQPAS